MRCISHSCELKAIYGTIYLEPLRCKKHRLKMDINCTQRRCMYCEKIASYGWPYDDAITCNTHRTMFMSRLRYPRCVECGDNAYFTDPGGDEPVRCGKHIMTGSINSVFSKCKLCEIIMTIQNLDHGLCIVCKKYNESINQKPEMEADLKRKRVDDSYIDDSKRIKKETSVILMPFDNADIYDIQDHPPLLVDDGPLMRSFILTGHDLQF